MPLYLLAANPLTWTVFSLRLLDQPRSKETGRRVPWEQACQPRSQGLSSLTTHGGGKMRDPGNEVSLQWVFCPQP